MSMPRPITNVPAGGVWKAGQPDKFSKMMGMWAPKVELWPLAACMGLATFFVAGIAWWSFAKMEVQINRSGKRSTDWSRARTEIIGHKPYFFGNDGKQFTHGEGYKLRHPMLDEVMDEVTKASESKAH